MASHFNRLPFYPIVVHVFEPHCFHFLIKPQIQDFSIKSRVCGFIMQDLTLIFLPP